MVEVRQVAVGRGGRGGEDEEEEEEAGGRRQEDAGRRTQEATDIKSNNPHLAGGEQHMNTTSSYL